VETLQQAKVLSREEREKQIRKLSMPPPAPLPARAGGKTSCCSIPWSISPNGLRSFWATSIRNFCSFPKEVLVTVMRDHQKYFAIEDANGKLAPHFLAVLNTDGDPQGIIQHGHERVLHARLTNARFFWQTDQKHPLRERAAW